MLSILIPIYNWNVVPLVKALHQQCEKAKIAFEIICFDDGSKPKFKRQNQVLSSMFCVSYVELSENKGRAKIRNWLAKAARYDHLLFLDCDSKVVSRKFIRTYLPFLDESVVVFGGRRYGKKPPRSAKKRLHWEYGRRREQLTVSKRVKQPYRSFQTNNFLIPRALFQRVRFDENIHGYGYEDSWFAHELMQAGAPIRHVDNPLEHLGLETTDVFLSKTQNALRNLAKLHQRHDIFQTRLTRYFHRIRTWALWPVFERYFALSEKRIHASLFDEKPSLFFFDLYRLHHFGRLYLMQVKEANEVD